jgi:hypothetical protein
MAVPVIKYDMFTSIRYDGRLIDVLDRIRAIELVLMVHIERDLGPDKELIKIKVLTPNAPIPTFRELRMECLGKIEQLKDMTLHEQSLVKLSS